MAIASSPLVSVIIPAYNAERFIEATLTSVISQTHKNIEVLVVDDGSKDSTPQIVEEFAAQDSRITLLQQKNAGVGAARNLAIHHSHGQYIAPIDSDDIWFPEKIEKQVHCLEVAGTDVGLVYNWCVLLDEQGNLTGRWSACHIEGHVLPDLIYRCFIGNASTPLIRRSCLDQVGVYKDTLKDEKAQGAEDWDLYLRIAEKYEYRVIPEFLVGYRQVRGSMSRDYAPQIKFTTMVMDEMQSRHPEIPPQVFRWSISGRCFSIAKANRQFGNYQGSLRWLLKAAQLDYEHLLHKEFYQILSNNLWQLLREKLKFENTDPAIVRSSIALPELEKKVQNLLASYPDRHKVRIDKLMQRNRSLES